MAIYKIFIEETSLSSIYVEADNRDEACVIASDRLFRWRTELDKRKYRYY